MNSKTALWPLLTPAALHGNDAYCAVSAKGVRIKFADGTEKLCGTSGLWNANLGYGNAAIAKAASKALRDASFLTVWGFENTYARAAADALIELAGSQSYARVLFSTSGGSANDAAMKLARHYHALRGRNDRKIILGLKGGYHGLTFGAFALSDVSLGQQLYGVDRRQVGHISSQDPYALDAILNKIGDMIAAIFVEPVIGNGTFPLSDAFVQTLIGRREKCGYLVVADEIATGFWRIGPTPFASNLWPEAPDILLTAKAMTNGTQAASALLVSHNVFEAFCSNNALLGHAETQAGTPVVCASILATISEMARMNAMVRSAHLSTCLEVALKNLVGQVPLATGARGKGCMRSLVLTWPDGTDLSSCEIDATVEAIRQAGALVHPGPSSVQILPALIYTPRDLDFLVESISEGLARVAKIGKLRLLGPAPRRTTRCQWRTM